MTTTTTSLCKYTKLQIDIKMDDISKIINVIVVVKINKKKILQNVEFLKKLKRLLC